MPRSEAKREEDTAQIVEGNFHTVETQLQTPEPKRALALPTLNHARYANTVGLRKAVLARAFLKKKPKT